MYKTLVIFRAIALSQILGIDAPAQDNRVMMYLIPMDGPTVQPSRNPHSEFTHRIPTFAESLSLIK